MTPAVVTGLRERPRGRVAVELDGAPWRLVPADAVVRAGLAVGRALDRESARALARELRRSEALGVALRALRHRDHSLRGLEARLAARGTRPDIRKEALEALERAGLVDDARVAAGRAETLAGRGYGDEAIRFALRGEGIAAERIDEALASLEPEPERARRLLAERGATAGTLRRLAAKGFDAASLDGIPGFADGD